MINGISDHVGERVLNALNNGPIKLGLCTLNPELYLFFSTSGQVSNYARELVEDISDGLHPCLHNLFLELSYHEAHVLICICKLRIVQVICNLCQPVS